MFSAFILASESSFSSYGNPGAHEVESLIEMDMKIPLEMSSFVVTFRDCWNRTIRAAAATAAAAATQVHKSLLALALDQGNSLSGLAVQVFEQLDWLMQWIPNSIWNSMLFAKVRTNSTRGCSFRLGQVSYKMRKKGFAWVMHRPQQILHPKSSWDSKWLRQNAAFFLSLFHLNSNPEKVFLGASPAGLLRPSRPLRMLRSGLKGWEQSQFVKWTGLLWMRLFVYYIVFLEVALAPWEKMNKAFLSTQKAEKKAAESFEAAEASFLG